MNNLTFWGYYINLKNEKAEFIKKVADATGKSQRTVYNWLNGTHPISANDQLKIRVALNIPPSDAFFFLPDLINC